jgi:hypothetical protein
MRFATTERYSPGWVDPRVAEFRNFQRDTAMYLHMTHEPTLRECKICGRETPHLGHCVYAFTHGDYEYSMQMARWVKAK